MISRNLYLNIIFRVLLIVIISVLAWISGGKRPILPFYPDMLSDQ